MRLHKNVKREDESCSSWTMQLSKYGLQPHIYSPLETCIAKIVPRSGSLMVPTSNKEDERSPVIRGETAASSGAKSAARAQPMGALPGFVLLSVLLQQRTLPVLIIGCVAGNESSNPSNTTFTADVRY